MNEYADCFTELSERQKASLYVILDCDKETSYVQYALADADAPSIVSEMDKWNSNYASILLKRTVYWHKFAYVDHRLDRYRNVLPTLRNLSNFEKDLLSSHSYDIIWLESEEKRINEALAPLYLDTYSGEVCDQIQRSSIPRFNQRIADVHLPVRHEQLDDREMYSRLGLDVDHEDWDLSKSAAERVALTQLVPFDIFVEKVDD